MSSFFSSAHQSTLNSSDMVSSFRSSVELRGAEWEFRVENWRRAGTDMRGFRNTLLSAEWGPQGALLWVSPSASLELTLPVYDPVPVTTPPASLPWRYYTRKRPLQTGTSNMADWVGWLRREEGSGRHDDVVELGVRNGGWRLGRRERVPLGTLTVCLVCAPSSTPQA